MGAADAYAGKALRVAWILSLPKGYAQGVSPSGSCPRVRQNPESTDAASCEASDKPIKMSVAGQAPWNSADASKALGASDLAIARKPKLSKYRLAFAVSRYSILTFSHLASCTTRSIRARAIPCLRCCGKTATERSKATSPYVSRPAVPRIWSPKTASQNCARCCATPWVGRSLAAKNASTADRSVGAPRRKQSSGRFFIASRRWELGAQQNAPRRAPWCCRI